MSWVVDPFALGFQQRALIGSSLVAIALAIVGTWVVIRGMTFLGDALVHGVIPGIALAIIFDVNVLLGAAAAALVMIAGITVVQRQTRFTEDTSIGLLFVGMLALGVIIVSRTPSSVVEFNDVLFGDALGVTTTDLIVVSFTAAVALGASLWLYRPFLVVAFNWEKAQLLGLRPGLAHAALLGLVTLVIVSSFQTVGTLLVFGLLVGPPATAALLVRRVPAMMGVAALIGVGSVVVGLAVGHHAGTSGSATMALVPIVAFFAVLASQRLRIRLRRNAPQPAARSR